LIAALNLGPERSVGFPEKNTTPVLGRPLISYPRLVENSAKRVDEIYVSTDSKKIKKIALEHEVKIIDLHRNLRSRKRGGIVVC